MDANVKEQEKVFTIEAKQDKKQINQLEKELRRKDKALAETAALLVLRKSKCDLGGKPRTNDPRHRSRSSG